MVISWTHLLRHDWGKWEDCTLIRSVTPYGYAYPAEVIGKRFETKSAGQVRTCSTCGKRQTRKVQS